MIGSEVALSSAIQPVTATSRRAALTRRLESLRASHGPVKAHSSLGGAACRTGELLKARKTNAATTRFIRNSSSGT